MHHVLFGLQIPQPKSMKRLWLAMFFKCIYISWAQHGHAAGHAEVDSGGVIGGVFRQVITRKCLHNKK